ERDAGRNSHFLEGAVSAIHEEEVLHRVVGDEDVGPSVAVVIETDYAEAVALLRADSRGAADIGESSIPVVVKERRRLAVIFAGVAIGAVALLRADEVVFGCEVDVVGDDEIEAAVVIVIEPGAARSP